MNFPKYPAYKDSGVEWLGEVPGHWCIKRYKQIFSERGERSFDGSEELMSVSAYYGVKPRAETLEDGDHLSRAESLEGYKICRAKDLVMNIMLAWNRGLGFAWQDGIVSPAYSVFRVTDDSDPKYLDYLVRSNEMTRYFKAYSAGVIDSRLRLYPETFGRLYVATPPKTEQTQIARFLDHETARIDALIKEQQRLIELLKEKRQAVISHAVTKGLDPMVPMKDSGVEWLGEVPTHWESWKVSHAYGELGSGTTPPTTESEWYENGTVPWVTTGELRESVILETKKLLSPKALSAFPALRLHPAGSLAIAMYGATIGRLGILGVDATVNQACCLLTRPSYLHVKFTFYCQWPLILTHFWPIKLTHLGTANRQFSASADSSHLPA